MSHQQTGLGTLVSLFLVLYLFLSVDAISATFNVNSLVDEIDSAPGDGACISLLGGLCTLRAAIQETNALASDDTIILDAQTYLLTIAGEKEDAAATGDLDITGGGDLVIQGADIKTTVIDANRLIVRDRIFHIHSTAGNVIFNKFTARNAWVYHENGGGIYNSGSNTILNEVEISDNYAITLTDTTSTPVITTYGVGGGIYNDTSASLLLDRSNVIFNLSGNREFYDTASMTFSGGGGIRNLGYLEVRNQSRIEHNKGKQGGGISNTGVVKITDSIIMFNGTNHSFGTGGGISNQGGVLTVRRSYIGDNSCSNCDGAGISNYPGPFVSAIAVILESAIDNNDALLGMGGGISNFSDMYIGYSSVSWNSADGLGGGISNSGNAELMVENTSITGNYSQALGAYGAGIHTSAAITLNQVSLTGNFANGIFAEDLYINTREFDLNDPGDWVTIKNSIIGDEAYRRKLFVSPTAIAQMDANPDNFCGGGYSENEEIGGGLLGDPNISTTEYLGLIKSQGYNITNGSTCALSAVGDQINTAPNLLDAGAYGGAALPPGPFLPNPISRPPASNSPARDVIPTDNCTIQFDQRMFGRPSGGACDVGASEEGDLVVPYADLELIATSEPGFLIARGQSVLYKIVIRNIGPNVTNDLTGSALVTNFKLSGMTFSDSSFIAPGGVGQVSCAKTTNTRQVACSFDSPLMPDTELLIYLTLIADGAGSSSVTAQINGSTTPDPFDYNNSATLNHRISGDVQLPISDPPEEATPITTNGGTMGLHEILVLTILAAICAFFRTNARVKLPTKFGISSIIIFYFTTSHAVVPTITNITPNTGSAVGETVVTISGTGFDQNVKIGLLNDPTISSVVARVQPTNAFYVEKKNNLLYLARNTSGASISVYDVTNPSAPLQQIFNMHPLPPRGAGGLSTGASSTILGMAARQDNRLFVPITGLGSLAIYDFNSPSAPILMQTFPVFTRKDGLHPTIGKMQGVEVDGELLYIVQQQGGGVNLSSQPGLYIIDTSVTVGANILSFTPLYPSGAVRRTEMVTVPTATGPRKYFLFAGARTMVSIDGTPTEGELLIFDVTDPAKPVAVYAVNGPSRTSGANDRIWDVAVKLVPDGVNTKVYAVVASKNSSQLSRAGLHVYDVGPDTGFTQLNPIGSYYKLGNFDEVFMDGDVVTALDLNLEFDQVRGYDYYDFDISDPAAPKLIGGPYSTGLDGDYYPWHSKVSDGHIYATGGFIYKRSPSISITNVTATTITATIPAGFVPQLYDLVVTNQAGETEEIILLNAFTVQ